MSEPLFTPPVEGDDDDSYLSSDMTPRKLRRSTAKEELVALCDDFIDAVLLNQMIKYQASCRDREAYIEEERRRMATRGQILNLPHSRGFFYKKMEELSRESMVGLHKTNIGKRLKKFEAKGWIEHRRNPNDPFDYVFQYRVDVVEIDKKLKELGFPGLDGWLMTRINSDFSPPGNEPQPRSSESQLRRSGPQSRRSEEQLGGSEDELPFKENKQQQQVVTKQVPTNKAPTDRATPTGIASADFAFLNFAAAASEAKKSEPNSSASTTSAGRPATPGVKQPVAADSIQAIEPDQDAEPDDDYSPEKIKHRQLLQDMMATGEIAPEDAELLLQQYGVDACDLWVDQIGKLEEMASRLSRPEKSQITSPATSAASLLPNAAKVRLVIDKLLEKKVTPKMAEQWVAKFGAAGMDAQLAWVIEQKPRSVARFLNSSITDAKPFGPLFEDQTTGISYQEQERDELLAATDRKSPLPGVEEERLDGMWSRMDAATRAKLDDQIERKMGVIGAAVEDGEQSRTRMRRNYMKDLLAGKSILEDVPSRPVVVRQTGTE